MKYKVERQAVVHAHKENPESFIQGSRLPLNFKKNEGNRTSSSWPVRKPDWCQGLLNCVCFECCISLFSERLDLGL